jgi:hypothetical protein
LADDDQFFDGPFIFDLDQESIINEPTETNDLFRTILIKLPGPVIRSGIKKQMR